MTYHPEVSSVTPGPNGPKIGRQRNSKCSRYLVVKLVKGIEENVNFFANKIDSKYQIMTLQLINDMP